MNIILSGMMGVGKTSVAIKIAERTRFRWYDTDIMISERHGKISDLFEYYGEEHFRALETDIVRELSGRDDLVISTGGGLVLRRENSELLRQNGKIVFLRATFETLLTRVRADESRPLLKDAGRMAENLGLLLAERTPIYEANADLIVDTDGKTVEEVAAEVLSGLGEPL